MRYTILFVIALICVSGFIAYFGDILGRRMGKRRLTLFGMRPKYTAIVVTTITGMIISGLALFALISVNPTFTRMFSQGERIWKQNRALLNSNTGLIKRNQALVAKSRQLAAEMKVRQAEVIQAREQSARAIAAEKRAESVVARLERDIAARKRELENVRRRNEAAVTELNIQTEQLHAVQKQYRSAQASLVRARADNKAAVDVLLDRQKQLAATQNRLLETQSQVAEADQKLAEQGKALEEQRRILEEQHKLLVQVGRERIEFEQQASELRTRDLIFRRGDELARAVVSPRQSAFGVRSDVFSLLEAASDRAKEDGAVLGTNGRAVSVVFRQNADDPYTLPLTESRCIDLAVDRIGTSPYDVMVRVVCGTNTLSGKQVPVELLFYVNSRIYRKDELIASGKLDGRLSEGRILLAVMDFLQSQVGKVAVRAGVIPVAAGTPGVGAGQDKRVQVEALMGLVEKIRQQDARAKVDVYAATDVYAAGPLSMDKMRFEISAIK
jgi:uncharacterized protein (DUF3084 family)